MNPTAGRMRFLCCVAVVLCVAASSADDLPWWKTAIFYQVYPRSFMDSDGDGVGDLRGIIQKADYFTEIGVNAIWLSPICKSPMADFGYDVSDFKAIDPIFGTMQDFEDLVAKLREIDVKLVLDFVPNHSSDEHEWFQKSLDKTSDYSDFYVWKDAKGFDASGKPIPPNNWIGVMSGPAWTWRDERQQFYFHQFITKQPDLNYRNPLVYSNMTDVVKFWLQQGVDGFRIDSVPYVYEDVNFPDDPLVPGTDGSTYDDLVHKYDKNQPETVSLMKYWADVVNDQVVLDGRPRAIFLEAYGTLDETMQYFGTGNESLEMPFNFELLSNGNKSTRPADIKALVDDWMNAMPKTGVANWVVGNHDNERVSDRYGDEMVDAINLLTGVLPGIKVVYNGEEIGMQDTFIRWDQTVDPQGILAGESGYLATSRDPERTPMQWDGSVSAGFSTNATTWLPVNPDYYWLNVDAQMSADVSHLKVFQAMAQARKDPVLLYGDYQVLVPNNDTLMVVRSYKGAYFVLMINMGSEILEYTSSSLFKPLGLDVDMSVFVGSVNSGYSAGTKLMSGSLDISLRPKAAILLTTENVTPATTPAPSSSTTQLSCATVLLGALFTLLWR